ncbi:MAG: hypothetical protein HC884_07625 [Chloroflexaceae bacterium]|nr:hypothetical protein [Chloroflexaceae bacterium]
MQQPWWRLNAGADDGDDRPLPTGADLDEALEGELAEWQYVKELMARGDVQHCLMVCPGRPYNCAEEEITDETDGATQEERQSGEEDGSHRVADVRRSFQQSPDFGVTSVNYDLGEMLARVSDLTEHR